MMSKRPELNSEHRLDISSADVTVGRIDALRELIPEAFSEGRVDFEKLRAALGDHVDDGPERYGLNWAGKVDAIRVAQSLSTGTLLPMPDESVNFDTSQT